MRLTRTAAPILLLAAVGAALAAVPAAATTPAPPSPPPALPVVLYSAAFSGPAGAPLPPEWTQTVNAAGVREPGTNSDDAGTAVARLNGVGQADIHAYRDAAGNLHSAVLNLHPGFDIKPGMTVTVKTLAPNVAGVVPAVWLVSTNQADSVPATGYPFISHGEDVSEIDITEQNRPDWSHQTLHAYDGLKWSGGSLRASAWGGAGVNPLAVSVWHTYRLWWGTNAIEMDVDGVRAETFARFCPTPASTDPRLRCGFSDVAWSGLQFPERLLLSMQTGGWGGATNAIGAAGVDYRIGSVVIATAGSGVPVLP